MAAKKSDLASAADCDWSFIEREDVMTAIRRLAYQSARRKPELQADDVEQELVLWLAVRPDIQDRPLPAMSLALYGRVRDIEKGVREHLPLKGEIAPGD